MPLLSRILPEELPSPMIAAVLVFAGAFFLHRQVVRHYPGWEYLIFAQKRRKPVTDGQEKEIVAAAFSRSASINEPPL